MVQVNSELNWNENILKFINENQLTEAYWLSRCQTQRGKTSIFPEWLIAAFQASQWLVSPPKSHQFIDELQGIVRNYPVLENTPQEIKLMGLATAIQSVLYYPEIESRFWLIEPTGLPELSNLVRKIVHFVDNRGGALLPEDVQKVLGTESIENAIDLAKSAIDDWQRDLVLRRMAFQSVWQIRQHFVSRESKIYKDLIAPALNDSFSRDQADKQNETLNSFWNRREKVEEYIQAVDKGVNRKRYWGIKGNHLERLIRDVRNIRDLSKRWVQAVEHRNLVEERSSWITGLVKELRDGAEGLIPNVEDEIDKFMQKQNSRGIKVAASTVLRSLSKLKHMLCIDQSESVKEVVQPLFDFNYEETLKELLSRPLIFLPELELDDTGVPTDADLNRIPSCLLDNYTPVSIETEQIEQIIFSWLEKEDYRFLDQLEQLCNEKDYSTTVTNAKKKSQSKLSDQVENTFESIEQAIVDGLISEEEHSEYTGIVEGIKDGIESIDHFTLEHRKLDDVRNRIQDSRKERMETLEKDWQGRKSNFSDHSEGSPEEKERFIESIEHSIENGDARVIDEYFAEMDANRMTELFGTLMVEKNSTESNPFEQYQECYESLLRISSRGFKPILKNLEESGNLPGELDPPRRLSRKHIRDAKEAMSSWMKLKRAGSSIPTKQIVGHLTKILGFLDLNLKVGPDSTINRESDWLYAKIEALAPYPRSPVPEFGSRMNGLYHIVCFWDRPGSVAIESRVHHLNLGRENVLLFYLGRLVPAPRDALMQTMKAQELSIAILDEILLLYLMRERDNRFETFLNCALPYTSINPYTPYGAGDVSPELFFGRQSMANELQRDIGGCIVYGGRQLGKSALLRHVKREFETVQDCHAEVIDVKKVGDPTAGQPTDTVLYRLRDALKRRGIIEKSITDNSNLIVNSIREVFNDPEHKNLRVLFMLDETDSFLAADSKDSFRITEALRDLMVHSERRFKVVFAGLQNVQKYQEYPNQPFAHLGMNRSALCVGPLEPHAARELVKLPLEALGYRFDTDNTLLRIFSYTNYHPVLIQLFCREIIRRKHQRKGLLQPPFSITRDDVEAIYRDREIRKAISDLFNWTVNLDELYQVTAKTMINEHKGEERSNYAKTFIPNDLYREIKENIETCEGEGLKNVSSDEFKGVMNELVGLGVLVSNENGYYRLRSPNLVRLMGTTREIEDQLFDLYQKGEFRKTMVADSYRFLLRENPHRYSNLTFSQSGRLAASRSGVGLIFTSDALGSKQLVGLEEEPNVFDSWASQDDKNLGLSLRIPDNLRSELDLSDWLRNHYLQNATAGKLICHQYVDDEDGINIHERLRTATKFCSRRSRSQRQLLRVIFVLSPSATYEWFLLPSTKRDEIENRLDCVTAPTVWDETGLKLRLEHLDMPSNPAQILGVTGGWPWLLDHLFDQHFERGKTRNPEDHIEGLNNIEFDLQESSSDLHKSFYASLGLDCTRPLLKQIFHFICDVGVKKTEDLDVDLIKEYIAEISQLSQKISQEQVNAALQTLKSLGLVEINEANSTSLEVNPLLLMVYGSDTNQR